MTAIVSIIIPTFNVSKTLRVALDSVKNQTFQKWECIVIDSVSKDSTLEIVQEYVANDSRFRFISEQDNGIFDAMNKGFKKANGEWIHFLGADDELLPNGLEDLVENSAGIDIVYGNTILVLGNGKTRPQYSKEISGLKTRFGICHQSIIMKKTVLESLGGFNLKYKIAADYEIVLRAYLNGIKFRQINCFISRFSVTGTSGKNVNKISIEKHQIFKSHKTMKFPIIYTAYNILRGHMVLLKHKTLDKIIFYK